MSEEQGNGAPAGAPESGPITLSPNQEVRIGNEVLPVSKLVTQAQFTQAMQKYADQAAALQQKAAVTDSLMEDPNQFFADLGTQLGYDLSALYGGDPSATSSDPTAAELAALKSELKAMRDAFFQQNAAAQLAAEQARVKQLLPGVTPEREGQILRLANERHVSLDDAAKILEFEALAKDREELLAFRAAEARKLGSRVSSGASSGNVTPRTPVDLQAIVAAAAKEYGVDF